MEGFIAFVVLLVLLSSLRAARRWKRRTKYDLSPGACSLETKDLSYFARHPMEMDGRNPFRPSL